MKLQDLDLEKTKKVINNKFGNIVKEVYLNSDKTHLHIKGYLRSEKKLKQVVIDHLMCGMKLVNFTRPFSKYCEKNIISICLTI